MITIPAKRGDTFKVRATARIAGVVVDLTGWTIRCQIRNKGELISTVTVVYVDRVNGVYDLVVEPVGTALWPPVLMLSDIEYTNPSGIVASTETFAIDGLEDETYTP